MKNITSSDITLAKAYFTILVETAIKKTTISYGDLVSLSKERYSDDKEIAGGIATTAGRRLEVLRDHTDLFGLADISCLVVNAGTQEAGDAYHLKEKAESLRLAVYETEWLDYYAGILKALDTTKAKWVGE
jgi:hypothetical protein